MSDMIAARARGDLRERLDEENDRLGDDVTRSELVRELLDEALRARTEPLYVRLGLPNRHAARLENKREAGEAEEDVVRRVLRETVETWDDDVLDAIGATDELREAVNEAREEGESLDDAVARLIRVGAEETGSGRYDRIQELGGVASLSFAVLLTATWFGTVPTAGIIVLSIVTLGVYPYVRGAFPF